MSQYVDPSVLTGFFKEVYGDEVIQLVPDQSVLLKEVEFREKDKTGNFYHQPVTLANENGFTYAQPDAGAYALNASVALTMKDAQLKGSQITLRSSVAHDAIVRASSNKVAFGRTTELLVKNMMESMSKRVEIALLYGQTGLGSSSSSTNINATTTRLQLTAASWACGIFASLQGAPLDIYDGLVKLNTVGAVSITLVDFANKRVTVTGAAADITAIDAGTFPLDIYFFGAKDNEMAGLDKILSNTGTLFNIDAATYNLWKSVQYDNGGGQLSLAKIMDAVSEAVKCGGLMEDVKVLCSPETWKDLHDDEAAFRVYDSSYSSDKSKRGTKRIEYFGQNGIIEVVPHMFVKEGEAFIIVKDKMKRIGAQEISFNAPGVSQDLFERIPDRNGYEIRLHTDQALFIECPAKFVKISNIVNG